MRFAAMRGHSGCGRAVPPFYAPRRMDVRWVIADGGRSGIAARLRRLRGRLPNHFLGPALHFLADLAGTLEEVGPPQNDFRHAVVGTHVPTSVSVIST